MSPAEIKSAREAMGMTIASFAFWLGLEGENGRRKIRAFESGKENPSAPIRRAIQLGLELARIRAVLADHRAGAIEGAEEALKEIERILGRDPPALHSISTQKDSPDV